MTSTCQKGHIAFYADHLQGGGGQKVPLMIAGSLAERGHKVDLVVCRARGQLVDEVPEKVKVVELKATQTSLARAYALAADPRGLVHVLASGTLPYLRDLVRYLRREKPTAIYSARPYMNIEASLARRLAGVKSRLVVNEQNTLSHSHVLASSLYRRFLPPLLRRAYMKADAIIAASDGVADDLAALTGLPRESITTIYPAVPSNLPAMAERPLDHHWFQPASSPVVLGVGRLTRAKDFPTLIRAFARVRQHRRAHLLILGEAGSAKKTAKRREEYMALASDLGIANDVELPGYVKNPFPYMARASVFVLSSITEGFGMVLVEALACGCPVVSTNCPSGPSEILEHGKFGALLPVRDDAALAEAISATLDVPPDPERLRARGTLFSNAHAADRHEEIFVGCAS